MSETPQIKVTPAMLDWCRAISDVADCRIVRTTRAESPQWEHYRTEGVNRKPKPTWAMADRLVDAGLIDWAFRGTNRGTGYDEHVAILTAKGRAEADREVEPAAVRGHTGWPFPVSAHEESA